jgi:hypothetical protein
MPVSTGSLTVDGVALTGGASTTNTVAGEGSVAW